MLEGTEAMELVKELAVNEDREKEEEHRKKCEEYQVRIRQIFTLGNSGPSRS